jgi:hypothetical protein
MNDVRPDSWAGGPAQPGYHHQLGHLLVCLATEINHSITRLKLEYFFYTVHHKLLPDIPEGYRKLAERFMRRVSN